MHGMQEVMGSNPTISIFYCNENHMHKEFYHEINYAFRL